MVVRPVMLYKELDNGAVLQLYFDPVSRDVPVAALRFRPHHVPVPLRRRHVFHFQQPDIERGTRLRHTGSDQQLLSVRPVSVLGRIFPLQCVLRVGGKALDPDDFLIVLVSFVARIKEDSELYDLPILIFIREFVYHVHGVLADVHQLEAGTMTRNWTNNKKYIH